MERRTRPARQRTAGSTWKASMESPPRTWLAAACTSARTLLASCRRRSLTWHHSAIATTGAITTNIPVTSFISFLLREKKKPGKGKSAVDVGKRRRLIRPALARYGSDCRRRARSCDDQATGGIAARRRRVSARLPASEAGPPGGEWRPVCGHIAGERLLFDQDERSALSISRERICTDSRARGSGRAPGASATSPWRAEGSRSRCSRADAG